MRPFAQLPQGERSIAAGGSVGEFPEEISDDEFVDEEFVDVEVVDASRRAACAGIALTTKATSVAATRKPGRPKNRGGKT